MNNSNTVAVFGATGRTGLPLVERLLEKGYHVRAQVRTPAKLTLTHPNLTVHEGDIMDSTFVKKIIDGSDAVVTVIGHVKNSPKNVQEIGTANLIAGMQQVGAKRLVSLTGAGIPFEKDQPKLIDKFFRGVMNTFFKDVIADGKAHAALIRNSGLDYTIVRAPRIVDASTKGTFKEGYVGQINSSITYPDLAHWIVNILEKDRFIQDEPAVSN